MEALREKTKGVREGPSEISRKRAEEKLRAKARAKKLAAKSEKGDKAEEKTEDKSEEAKEDIEKPESVNGAKAEGKAADGLNRRQRRALARGEAPVKGKLSAAAARKAKQAQRSKDKKVERKESAANTQAKAETKKDVKAEVKDVKGKAKKGRASLPGNGDKPPAKRPRKSMP